TRAPWRACATRIGRPSWPAWSWGCRMPRWRRRSARARPTLPAWPWRVRSSSWPRRWASLPDRMRLPAHGHPSLRSFLRQLRRDGDLVVVEAPVDARLEVPEIHRRVIVAGGPALLFANVRGADFPLATNLFGTAGRAELAFGPRPHAFIRRMVSLAESLLPPTPAKLWDARDVAAAAARIGLRRVTSGPVTEVMTS